MGYENATAHLLLRSETRKTENSVLPWQKNELLI